MYYSRCKTAVSVISHVACNRIFLHFMVIEGPNMTQFGRNVLPEQ